MKRFFSYGLAFLLGAIIAAATISFYWPASEISHDVEEEEQEEQNLVSFSQEQIQKKGFVFQTASPGTLLFKLSTRGKIVLHPDRLAHIIPKVPGVAKEANKNIGNFVKANEIVAVLESREIADAKAAYLAALSKERLAASALEREEKLYEEKISAGQDYQSAKNIYEEALINVELSRQALRSLGLNAQEIASLVGQNKPDLCLYSIRSPIDGVVIMRHITKGEVVEDTHPIYEVADLSKVWVEIGIYPKDHYLVKEGQGVDILLPQDNKNASAKLIFVSPIIAEETITAKAIAELDNPEGIWRPGVFVNVNIATEKLAFPIVIPKEAVQTSEGKDFVFIVTNDGFERRFVKLGKSDLDNVEVISGLNPGEQYVANKTFLLKADLGKSSVEDD